MCWEGGGARRHSDYPWGEATRLGVVGRGGDLRNLLLPREREDVCREQVGWKWEAGTPVLSRGTRQSSKPQVARGEAVWRWEPPNSGSFWAVHSTLSLRAGSPGSRWGVPGGGVSCATTPSHLAGLVSRSVPLSPSPLQLHPSRSCPVCALNLDHRG